MAQFDKEELARGPLEAEILTSTEKQLENLMYVEHPRSKIRHHVIIGPGAGTMDSWVTACGWFYAKQAKARLVESGDWPLSHKQLCQKCFRLERERLKAQTAGELKLKMADKLG